MAYGQSTKEGSYGKFEKKLSKFEGKAEKPHGTKTRNKKRRGKRRR
jgi:hypothetical protein